MTEKSRMQDGGGGGRGKRDGRRGPEEARREEGTRGRATWKKGDGG